MRVVGGVWEKIKTVYSYFSILGVWYKDHHNINKWVVLIKSKLQTIQLIIGCDCDWPPSLTRKTEDTGLSIYKSHPSQRSTQDDSQRKCMI